VSLGDEIAGQGWRTGTVIPCDVWSAIEGHIRRQSTPDLTFDRKDWLVVVSQTCDVVAQKEEQEPFVEVLHCRPIAKLRTQYTELRSTRWLDFRPNRTTHPDLCLTAHATVDRYLVPRSLLRDKPVDPERSLDLIAAKRVLNWFALRYARPAWPDAFVRRFVKETKQQLEAALDPLRDDIAEIRISIAEDGELPDGQPYHVAVFFVVDEEIWGQNTEARAAIHAAFAKFVSVLSACEGIVVDQELSSVVSGGEFSWQATRSTDEWNFANLSNLE
jgi:hypothetical protein